MKFIESIIQLFRKEQFKQLASGNKLYYTRSGFGVVVSAKNKAKSLRTLAIRDQIRRNPDFIKNHPTFAGYDKK